MDPGRGSGSPREAAVGLRIVPLSVLRDLRRPHAPRVGSSSEQIWDLSHPGSRCLLPVVRVGGPSTALQATSSDDG